MERDILFYYPTSPTEMPFRALLTCPKPVRYTGIPASLWPAFYRFHLRTLLRSKLVRHLPGFPVTFQYHHNEQ